jgi:hypothetical protein
LRNVGKLIAIVRDEGDSRPTFRTGGWVALSQRGLRISCLSGLCDGGTMLCAPFLDFVRVNNLIWPNDAISNMALK